MIKMSDIEPNIIKEFRNLYDYVVLMGRHINGIHNRLETIEENIKEINASHSNFVKENSVEMTIIRENMVDKDEFNSFVEKMKVSIGEELPGLPQLEREKIQTDESSQEAIDQ